MCAQSLSCVQLFVTSWTVACQAPLSMGFSRQEHWSGLPFPSPGDLPKPGLKSTSLAWPVGSLPPHHLGSPHTTLDLSQEVFCLLLLTVYYSLVLLAMKIQSSGTHFPFSTALCHWGSECFAFQSVKKFIHRNMKMQSVD